MLKAPRKLYKFSIGLRMTPPARQNEIGEGGLHLFIIAKVFILVVRNCVVSNVFCIQLLKPD